MEISDNDRLIAALGYPLNLIALIVILLEDTRQKEFLKYHAVQSLAVAVIMLISSVTVCLPFLIWLYTFYLAYEAYMGHYVEIPFVTDFCKSQGWI